MLSRQASRLAPPGLPTRAAAPGGASFGADENTACEKDVAFV